ncbi:phosphoribosylglycinamide formyltransferase [Burkholderiaceae bacterium FT117]|uniref:phosphoribosylglycinamide formyltransferase n=1 Tax=Zeimonas sediminis TaxID=2944268 RepID=UPI002342D227|nr:phosphoribosylglycinamide formyltransferase [Zeimonas sediminis]MCM5572247.1 phosphoribosylglycinamide formyltransferase [Zeimonas sediminis]
MKKIVILISGRGSNMVAIARACEAEAWPARIVAVIGNRPGAEGLARAAELGLPVRVVDHREHADRESFDAALAAEIDALAPDLIVLAGFMRILTDGFVRRYAGRMLNIHPSLLPAFPGLATHRRALAAGVRVHGSTVHFVGAELDDGPILAQAAVEVRDEDTEQTLEARVLEAEHRLYPMAVRWFVEGRLHVEGRRVRLLPRGEGPAGGAAGDSRLVWSAT